jgi:hypothetical protein
LNRDDVERLASKLWEAFVDAAALFAADDAVTRVRADVEGKSLILIPLPSSDHAAGPVRRLVVVQTSTEGSE